MQIYIKKKVHANKHIYIRMYTGIICNNKLHNSIFLSFISLVVVVCSCLVDVAIMKKPRNNNNKN